MKVLRSKNFWLEGILVVAVLLSVGLLIITAVVRQLSQLELVLSQVLFLIVGCYASFHFGKLSSQAAAREMVKPHIRSAFRRLVTLYMSISTLGMMIAKEQEQSKSSGAAADPVLSKMEGIVMTQIMTADDALEDWSDTSPEDVEELRKKFEDSEQEERCI